MSLLSDAIGCVACVCFLAGCDGGVTTEDDGSSTATGAGGTTSASSGATSSGTTNSSSSAGVGGGTSCENVPEYIDNLYQAAAECNPADPSLHCQDVVDGYCCPVVVESISSPATQAYLDFLELTKQQCTELWRECAAVDCAFPTPGNCVADGSTAGGHCSNGF
jgi:hypothetical protein